MDLAIVIGVISGVLSATSLVSTIRTLRRAKRNAEQLLGPVRAAADTFTKAGLTDSFLATELWRLSPSDAVIAAWHDVESALGRFALPEDLTRDAPLWEHQVDLWLVVSLKALRDAVAHHEDIYVDAEAAWVVGLVGHSLGKRLRAVRNIYSTQ